MTERINTLTPSLLTLGEFIQEHAQQGYRLIEGYPAQSLWQYEVCMERAEQPVIEQPAPETRKPGRPAKAQ